MSEPRVIVALDFAETGEALSLARRLEPARCRLKVGKALFTRAGPGLVRTLVDRGFDVFLDLKYHDIPHTVSGACRAAAELGVWMVNVHALGGAAMLLAARDGVDSAAHRPLLVAVTLLTSMDDAALLEVGLGGSSVRHVTHLAEMAQRCGLDGVVCSAQEIGTLRHACGEALRLVTPGIRLQGAAHDDQKRTATPGEALRMGADYLVIGRPITAARDPLRVLAEIEHEMSCLP